MFKNGRKRRDSRQKATEHKCLESVAPKSVGSIHLDVPQSCAYYCHDTAIGFSIDFHVLEESCGKELILHHSSNLSLILSH